MRNWLVYFHQDKNIPLIVDEWNYDRNANVLPSRGEQSYIAASFIPSRIKNMHESGINYQIYFCLEDFQGNKEGVVRNVGLFYFDPEHSSYKGGHKATYNAFRMLNKLGNDLYQVKTNDPFTGVIATKTQDGFAIITYNYIDPDIVNNYLYKNICSLNSTGRKILLNLIRSKRLDKILNHEIQVSSLGLNRNLRTLLQNVLEINDKTKKFVSSNRTLKINLKNIKGDYTYQKYTIDSSCRLGCEFKPQEDKDINVPDSYHEELMLAPYSLHLIVLKKKSKESEPSEKKE